MGLIDWLLGKKETKDLAAIETRYNQLLKSMHGKNRYNQAIGLNIEQLLHDIKRIEARKNLTGKEKDQAERLKSLVNKLKAVIVADKRQKSLS